MIRLSIVVYFVLLFAMGYLCVEFRQEQAKINFVNPKYMSNVVALTRRVSRHEPYRTNLTGNILVPFGNNVTFSLILQLKSGGDFKISAKVCDCVKTKWMHVYMSQFTNLTLSDCPFKPGRYAYINMELPPKNVPIPVMDGDYYIIMDLHVTASKEKILEVATLLHFDPYSSNKKKDDKKNKDNKTDNKRDRKG